MLYLKNSLLGWAIYKLKLIRYQLIFSMLHFCSVFLRIASYFDFDSLNKKILLIPTYMFYRIQWQNKKSNKCTNLAQMCLFFNAMSSFLLKRWFFGRVLKPPWKKNYNLYIISKRYKYSSIKFTCDTVSYPTWYIRFL